MNVRELIPITKQAAAEWVQDRAPTQGAALAYYTLFSLAPLLMICIGLAGVFLGEEAAQGRIFEELRGLVGAKGAEAMEEMVRNASTQKGSSISATIIGAVTLLVGASTVFGQLQTCLNTAWGVEPKPGRGFRGMLKDRVLSFGLVLVIGFLLLVSLVLTAVVAGVGKWMGGVLPGGEFAAQMVNFVLSLAVIAALFAMIFKMLPDVKIAWRDVWVGALVTALLFVLGKSALGIYLGKSSVSSSFGAAGSLVVVVVWVYYSAQILIFGAEFTQVYANRFGSHVTPSANAEWVDEPMTNTETVPPASQKPAKSEAIWDAESEQLSCDLAMSRSRLSYHTSAIAERANPARRAQQSMKHQPVAWIAGGAALGLLIAARHRPVEKVRLRSAASQRDTRNVEKKAALLVGATQLAFRVFRPMISSWLRNRTFPPARNGSSAEHSAAGSFGAQGRKGRR